HFEAGEYEQALAEFRAAFDRSGRLALAYNVGLCYERLGQYADAADWLDRYLPAVTDAAERSVLTRRSENLRRRAEADATSAPSASDTAHADLDDDLDGGGPRLGTGALLTLAAGGGAVAGSAPLGAA